MSNKIANPSYETWGSTWSLSEGCQFSQPSDAQHRKRTMEVNSAEILFPADTIVGAHGQVVTLTADEALEARNIRFYVRKTQSQGGETNHKVFVRVFDGVFSPNQIIGGPGGSGGELAELQISFSSLSTEWTQYSITDFTPGAGNTNLTLNAGIEYVGGGTPTHNHKVEFDNWTWQKTEEEVGYKAPVTTLTYPENGPGPSSFQITEVDEIHGTMHKEGDFQIDDDLLIRDGDDEVEPDRDDLLFWRAGNRRSYRDP